MRKILLPKSMHASKKNMLIRTSVCDKHTITQKYLFVKEVWPHMDHQKYTVFWQRWYYITLQFYFIFCIQVLFPSKNMDKSTGLHLFLSLHLLDQVTDCLKHILTKVILYYLVHIHTCTHTHKHTHTHKPHTYTPQKNKKTCIHPHLHTRINHIQLIFP